MAGFSLSGVLLLAWEQAFFRSLFSPNSVHKALYLRHFIYGTRPSVTRTGVDSRYHQRQRPANKLDCQIRFWPD
jgi:hypothetical protein